MTIYIGNLSFQASEDDIKAVFAEYGEVSRISLPIDRETGRKRGFAFVDMTDAANEDKAIAELDGAEWLGRELKVNKARPQGEPRGGQDSRGDGEGRRPPSKGRGSGFYHNPL
ncbi:MAG: RNA-binding protein [Cyanobacteriota bacterium]|nr:RNA-binding protein [Cyanobacteriota bacterium]